MTKQTDRLEEYAAKPVLIFSGSLLVLSVALNNIGFKEVVDAYAKSIVYSIEGQKVCNADIDYRLKLLEKDTHSPTK